MGPSRMPANAPTVSMQKNLVLWHTEDETTFGIRKDVYTKEAKTFFDGNIYVPDDFDTIELA